MTVTIQTPRPDVAMLLAFLNAAPTPKMHEMSLGDARAAYLAMRPLADADPAPLATIKDIVIPGPAGPIPARLYDSRDHRDAGPAMIFFHGGGFTIGDLETHEPFCTEAAAQLDMPVIAVDYRLAPEHPFPAAPDDCEAAARWIAGSPAELGLEVTGLILCGDSAGGNLAIVTTIALRDTPAAVPVIAQAPFYPIVSDHNDWQSYRDFGEGHLLTKATMDWFTDAYQGVGSDPRHTPMLSDLAGLPPTLLITAGLDPLRDQGRAFAGRLIEAGVPTTYRDAVGTIHGFICLRRAIPSGAKDIGDAFTLLKAMVAAA